MKVRHNNPGVAIQVGRAGLAHGNTVMLMHLGRGGVQQDGSLDAYNQQRVQQTIRLARQLGKQFPILKINIIWTGGCNRKEARSGDTRPASEGGAALAYARTLIEPGDTFTMLAEEISTSTVENATTTAGRVSPNGVLVIATDPLHYLCGKVQFITWLVFPGQKVIFVELSPVPNTSWKSKVMHAISTAITVVGMTGVGRGDGVAIQRRQNTLQKYTGH